MLICFCVLLLLFNLLHWAFVCIIEEVCAWSGNMLEMTRYTGINLFHIASPIEGHWEDCNVELGKEYSPLKALFDVGLIRATCGYRLFVAVTTENPVCIYLCKKFKTVWNVSLRYNVYWSSLCYSQLYLGSIGRRTWLFP